MDKIVIADWIRSHEVVDNHVYTDPDGHSTIGIGFNLDEVGSRERLEGVGANFESVLDGTEPLTETQIEELFNQDIDQSISTARAIFPDLDSYPVNKQIAIIDMVYDLGERDFKKLDAVIDAIKQQHWNEASTKMLESSLFNQLSHRAAEEISLMWGPYTEPSLNLIDNGNYNGYPDSYDPSSSVPHYVDSPLNSLDTAITTIHLMQLMDMQHEHPEHYTVVDHAQTTPSSDTSVGPTEIQPAEIIPMDNFSPYIDSSLHPTPNDIYLMTDQPGDPGYTSFPDQTPTDLAAGTYVNYTETLPMDDTMLNNISPYMDPSPHPTANDIYLVTDEPYDPWGASFLDQPTNNLIPDTDVDHTSIQPIEDLPQSLNSTPLPTADDIYLNNDCLNVQGGWQTPDDLQEFMARNGFETNPPFNSSPGLEVYTDQAFPDSNLDGGHDFTSID